MIVTDPAVLPYLTALAVVPATLAGIAGSLRLARALREARNRQQLRWVRATLEKLQQMGAPQP